MALPDLIREFRDRLQISQRELATRAGLSQATVAKMELGSECEPMTSTLEALGNAIGVDPMELILLARASAKLRRDEK